MSEQITNPWNDNPWKPIKNIEKFISQYKDMNIDIIKLLNIDTRDFGIANFNPETLDKINFRIINKHQIQKYSEQTKKPTEFTLEECLSIMNKLYLNSGGDGEWRMISFTPNKKLKIDSGWAKYFNIIKSDLSKSYQEENLYKITYRDYIGEKETTLIQLTKEIIENQKFDPHLLCHISKEKRKIRTSDEAEKQNQINRENTPKIK